MITVIVATVSSLILTLVGTPAFIRVLRALGAGQRTPSRDPNGRGAISSPTMGGAVIIVSSCIGYLCGHLATGASLTMAALLLLGLFAGFGLVGLVNDLTISRKGHRLPLAVTIAALLVVSSVFAVLAIALPDRHGTITASTYISVLRDVSWLNLFAFGPALGVVLVILVTGVFTLGTAFGAVIADGLDGLVAGAAIFTLAAYLIIGFWQNDQSCFGGRRLEQLDAYKCYLVRDPHDVAVLAAAIIGSLIGFLWWNTTPAQIHLGNTGAIALGGIIAGFAIVTRTELLILLTGGLFTISVGSIAAQKIYSMATRGRRLLLATPLHRHFELRGWVPVTIVGRLWLIAAILVALAIGLFYLEWITR